MFTSIGVVPERSLRSLLRQHPLRRSYMVLSRNKVLKSICSEFDFPFHAQVHDGVLKNIAVFADKTLLEILLVGLNICLTMGEHSIAYIN